MTIGCIYIPHYPAWALLERDQTDPLLVVEGGRVAAASPEVRSEGVSGGMTTDQARSMAPDATVHPRDPALEAALWEEIEESLNETTPYIERDRPGRSFLRPHDREGLKKVVEDIGAQAALAPTRTDAILAAWKAISGEILTISETHQNAFRRKLPVQRLELIGVDPDIPERLRLFGYDTVAAAGELSKRHLEAQFGDEGIRLYNRLHAVEEPSVAAYSPPPTIEEQHRFEHPTCEPGPLETAIDTLLEDALEELGGQSTQRLTLRLSCRGAGRPVASRTLREPATSLQPLRSAASALLKRLLEPGREVDTLTLELGALEAASAHQGNLFFERPAVQEAIEAVHARYPGILQHAVLIPDAVFPEDRVRLEPALQ